MFVFKRIFLPSYDDILLLGRKCLVTPFLLHARYSLLALYHLLALNSWTRLCNMQFSIKCRNKCAVTERYISLFIEQMYDSPLWGVFSGIARRVGSRVCNLNSLFDKEKSNVHANAFSITYQLAAPLFVYSFL